MIERRTKVQLLVFVIITLVGVSFVGARYARLDRAFHDDTYMVVAHFAESGGIFAGGEVTYRGVKVGQVESMELTDEGVDVQLGIDEGFDAIPADAIALVGNRSAVGEQYVELQPQTDEQPFLEEDSEIPVENTRTPIQTQTLLTNLSDTVESVDKRALKTTVDEFGKAFAGTGDDLGQIIDTGNAFIEDADANFDVTTALIRDSNVVLQGQVDSETAIRTFARDLALFSDTLAASDGDLRGVIDSGSVAANELRTFIEDNEVQLGELINNLVTTGEVVVQHLDGIEQVLVLYPYVVEGGFTVAAKSPDTGLYDAHFGLIEQSNPPSLVVMSGCSVGSVTAMVVPVWASRRKISSSLFSSPGTRFAALEQKATQRPSALMAACPLVLGEPKALFPAWLPLLSTFTRSVVPFRRSRMKTSVALFVSLPTSVVPRELNTT